MGAPTTTGDRKLLNTPMAAVSATRPGLRHSRRSILPATGIAARPDRCKSGTSLRSRLTEALIPAAAGDTVFRSMTAPPTAAQSATTTTARGPCSGWITPVPGKPSAPQHRPATQAPGLTGFLRFASHRVPLTMPRCGDHVLRPGHGGNPNRQRQDTKPGNLHLW